MSWLKQNQETKDELSSSALSLHINLTPKALVFVIFVILTASSLGEKNYESYSLEATVAEKYSEIQAEINQLKEQIDKLRQAPINADLSSLKEKVEDIPKEKIKFSTSQYEASEGLTKEELCKKINLTGLWTIDQYLLN